MSSTLLTQLGEEYCDLWQVTRDDYAPSTMRRWMFVLCHTVGPLLVRNVSARARRRALAARTQSQDNLDDEEEWLQMTVNGESTR